MLTVAGGDARDRTRTDAQHALYASCCLSWDPWEAPSNAVYMLMQVALRVQLCHF